MNFLRALMISALIGWGQLAYGSPYACHVEAILDEGQAIKLTNGFSWQVNGSKKELLQWLPGDEVVLEKGSSLSCLEQYYLKNMRLNSAVWIQKQPWSIQEAAVYTIQKVNAAGSVFLLNDGSIWTTGILNALTVRWKEEERVLILPASDFKGYYLLNLDRPDDKMLYAALNFNREQSVYRHFIAQIEWDGIVAHEARIRLDNGFTWNLLAGWLLSTKQAHFDELSAWAEKDEVLLYASIDKDEDQDRELNFYLINLRTLASLPVGYAQQDEWISQRIEKIVRIKESLLSYETFISLTDGSYWKLDQSQLHVSASDANGWQEGDSIMVSPCLYQTYQKNAYYLINPDYGLRSKKREYSCSYFMDVQPK